MADKYVTKTGSDGASGAYPGSPWATYSFALGAMSSSDRLIVGNGTWVQGNTAHANLKNGIESAYTIIEAENYYEAIFTAPAGENIVRYPDLRQYVAMKGFRVDGLSNTSNYGIVGSTTISDNTKEGLFLLYEDILVINTKAAGIKAHFSNSIMRRVVARHCGDHGAVLDHGFYIGGADSDNLFEDCEADFNASVGFRNASNSGGGTVNNIYRRCWSHHNQRQGFYLRDIYQLENVKAHDNGSTGIQMGGVDGRCYFATAYNNGLQSSSAAGVTVEGGGTRRDVQNVISLGNKNDNYADSSTSTTKNISNNQTSGTPTLHWVSPVDGDFRLLETSTVRGGGLAVSGITTDFDGTTLADPPDIGAYQYAVANPEPPDTPTGLSVINAATAPALSWSATETNTTGYRIKVKWNAVERWFEVPLEASKINQDGSGYFNLLSNSPIVLPISTVLVSVQARIGGVGGEVSNEVSFDNS